ncbi:MAG TPA: hypothetical protein VMW78_10045 [Anaerolineae bacterium]|nr:hypothetical protein [Anaerolineae bacterium]
MAEPQSDWQQIIQVLIYFKDNWVAFTALITSVITLCITWFKNRKDRQFSDDKKLFEHLKQFIELAYKSLSSNDDEGRPTNFRERWLSAARHIERYRELKINLKTNLYKTICEGTEEYWSDRFYWLLDHIENKNFFKSVHPEKMIDEKIDVRSAAIVYSFSVWKKGRIDPVDNLDLEEIILQYKLYSPRHRVFWDYVQNTKSEIAKKVKQKIKNDTQ